MASPQRAALLYLAAAVLLLTTRLGARPLDAREVPFARAASGVVATGDLVGLAVDGAPRPDIPPLFTWVQAWCFRLFGEGPATARLPSVLATLGSLFLAGWVSRRRFGSEGAIWTAGVFLATPLVLVGARFATPDALLAVHVLGVVALETGAHDDSGGSRAAVLGALLGLAFLAKGPIGVLLPLAVMLGGRTASGQALMPRARNVGFAVGACAVVSLPWVLTLAHRVGATRLAGILRDGIFGQTMAVDAAARPPWFYAVVIAVGFVPWVGPLAIGILRAVIPGRGADGPTSRFAAGGFLCGLLLLSFGPVRDPMVVLSLAPLTAVLVTAEIGEELSRPRVRRWGRALVASVLVAAAVAAGAWAIDGDPRLRTTAILATLCCGAGAAITLVAVVLERPRLAYGSAVATVLAVFLAVVI